MHRLKNKYRLVILKETNFQEKASFSIKGINILAFLSIIFIIMFLVCLLLFGFTPLQDYLPGNYSSYKQEKITELAYKTDSLSRVLEARKAYLSNIKSLLKGNIDDTAHKITKRRDNLKTKSEEINLQTTSKEDSLLRAEFEQKDPYNLLFQQTNGAGNNELSSYTFFPPLKGLITSKFNEAKSHYAVDIVGPENVGIKAVLDGTVIFSEWSASTGHVIMLQHSNNLVSVYKHNSELLKKVGKFVQAGEVIAIIGESGELSTGPHLHFELWHNGTPVNPEKYISF